MSLIATIKRLAASQHFLPWFEFSTDKPPMSNGDLAAAQCDGSGAMLVATAPLNETSDRVGTVPATSLKFGTPLNTLERFRIVNVGFTKLTRVYAENRSGVTLYLQIHNTTAEPGAAAVPDISRPMLTNTEKELVFRDGRTYATGCTVCLSTTRDTYTAATASHAFDGEYYTA